MQRIDLFKKKQGAVVHRALRASACVLWVVMLSACGAPGSVRQPDSQQFEAAMARFRAHCETAGERIYRTVQGVESVTLLKRRERRNLTQQYDLDDPYGNDLSGDGYIASFLRGNFQASVRNIGPASPPRKGYLTVFAPAKEDGQMYSYTARFQNPGRRGPTDPGDFFLVRGPVAREPSRYGVTWEDISTKEDRDVWIAGSRLKVIDTQTGELLAERIGYMIDRRLGSTAGGRMPWAFAPDNACPPFGRDFRGLQLKSDALLQFYQTLDFVEKVLQHN